MDSKQLKHLADHHNFSIENDPIYSAIKYHTELENLLNELGRNDYKKEGGKPDSLEQICLSSLALRYSKWDFLDRRYFKSFWSGGGQLFQVPPFIDETEYRIPKIQIQVIAANIAMRLNTETDNFESYLAARKISGNWLDKYFDQLFFFSLGVTQEIFGNLNVLTKYLEEYVETEFGRRWIDDHAIPTLHFCSQLPKNDAIMAINKWRIRFGAECVKYYPVQRHYGRGSTAKAIAVELKDFLLEEWRRRLEVASSGYAHQEQIIRNEIRSFKLNYFNSEDDSIDIAIHYHILHQEFSLPTNAAFFEIYHWAEIKAAAAWISELSDYGESNRIKRNTNLHLKDFGALAYLLKNIGLFETRIEAANHLASFFRAQNKNGKATDINPTSLLTAKYRDDSAATELIRLFGEISK